MSAVAGGGVAAAAFVCVGLNAICAEQRVEATNPAAIKAITAAKIARKDAVEWLYIFKLFSP